MILPPPPPPHTHTPLSLSLSIYLSLSLSHSHTHTHTHTYTPLLHSTSIRYQACLIQYDYSPEAVIDHMLQENLPPHLRQLDQTLSALPANWQGQPHIESSTEQVKEGVSPESGQNDSCSVEGMSLLEQRSNVFDYDEFDVFNRKEVDRSRVHIGKR